jgi:hypothetical protein
MKLASSEFLRVPLIPVHILRLATSRDLEPKANDTPVHWPNLGQFSKNELILPRYVFHNLQQYWQELRNKPAEFDWLSRKALLLEISHLLYKPLKLIDDFCPKPFVF